MIDHFYERYGMRIKTVGADKRYFAKSFLAAPFKRRITPHICGQHYWTGGGVSVGETAEPASGVPPLTAGAEEDRRILERGEMLARLPSFSPARAVVGQRKSVSGELAA
jgi:hypothetical protein